MSVPIECLCGFREFTIVFRMQGTTEDLTIGAVKVPSLKTLSSIETAELMCIHCKRYLPSDASVIKSLMKEPTP